MCDPYRTCVGDEKRGFSDLTSKLVATACQWFMLKTRFLVFSHKTKVDILMIQTLKSPR
jgi:hypothetical protein